MVKVQTTLVASPRFGPIFGLLARNEIVFGIGAFEPPQPISDDFPELPRGTFLNKSYPRDLNLRARG
jgi:hypothetical protein